LRSFQNENSVTQSTAWLEDFRAQMTEKWIHMGFSILSRLFALTANIHKCAESFHVYI
jgi:hypothetical protein